MIFKWPEETANCIEITRALASMDEDAIMQHFDDGSDGCVFCEAWRVGPRRPLEVTHGEDCLWRRARDVFPLARIPR